MAYLIGVDEAGYGPNLGPLVIAGTCWRMDDAQTDLATVDLYKVLSKVVSLKASARRLAIADSKVLYNGRQNFPLLEEAVLATGVALAHKLPIWQGECEPDLTNPVSAELAPWYEGWTECFPLHTDGKLVEKRYQKLAAECDGRGVSLANVCSVFLTAKAFNNRLAQLGNKSTVLSHATLGLVRRLLDDCDRNEPHRVRIVCDKHGGRDYYLGVLQHFFPDIWWQTQMESRSLSRYTGCLRNLCLTIEFQSKGEGYLPTALASIYAKFHREVAMKAFNAFWQKEVPGIRPTAGYPGDAIRFRQETERRRQELALPLESFWRMK